MTLIREAMAGDVDRLVVLESALFAEDAGQHEPYADPTWPEREGAADFAQLIESPDSLLSAAVHGREIVGFLAGYVSSSSPTRQPMDFAVLRSLFVQADHRRSGAASSLTRHFVEWASARGAVEVHVDSYAANSGAQQLYEQLGFAVRSVTRVLPLATE